MTGDGGEALYARANPVLDAPMTSTSLILEPLRRRWRRLDRLVRLMIANWALGVGLGATLGGGMIGFDFMGLAGLLQRGDAMLAGSLAFVALFAFTFGGVLAASAAMRAGEDDKPGGGLGAAALIDATAPRGAR